MNGIKIVDLPNNTLPYTGTERIPITQDGETRNGTLNSFANYISAFAPPLTQSNIETAIEDKPGFLAEIGAVSSDGAGVESVDFRDSIRLDGWVDPRDYGTVTLGTGATTEQQTANVAAIQAALDTGRQVICGWVGDCLLNNALTINRNGQFIEGANMWLTVLRWTSISNGIQRRKDLSNPSGTDQGGNLIFGGGVRNLSIIGPGRDTSSGTGVDIDDATDAYNGDWVILDQCYIRGFNRGVHITGVGQCKIINSTITYHNVCIEFTPGAQNSHQVFGTSIVQASNTAVIMNSGNCVFQSGDYGSSPLIIETKAGSSATFMGGNFEGGLTQVVALIRASSKATFFAPQFLRPTATVAPISVEGLGKVTLVSAAGSPAGIPLVEKLATTAVVETFGMQTVNSNMGQDGLLTRDSTQSLNMGPWPQRYYNSMPTGSVASTRGLVVQQVGFSGFAPDGLAMIIQQKNGTLVRDWLSNYNGLESTPFVGTSGSFSNNSRNVATDNSSRASRALPTAASSEINISEIEVIGVGSAGWRITQLANQTIIFGASASTPGISGYLESAHARDVVKLKYVATNTWQVISYVGTPVTA